MILEGEFTIPASQQRVWDALWDIPTMASWVPGCTRAEQVDDRTYRVHLEQQVSMMKAAFDLLLTVAESEAPDRIVLTGTGEDRKLGSNVQIHSEIKLDGDEKETTLRYRHDVSVFGRIGALGFPLIQRKAKEAEAEFARRARASLGSS